MPHAPLRSALVALVLALALAPASARRPVPATLAYAIEPRPESRSFRISVRVEGVPDAAVELRMPSWQPASYALQPYAGAASRVAATDDAGAALEVSRPDASSWRVASGGRAFTFAYDLDVGERQKLYSKSYADSTAGAIQAAGALVYLPARRDARVKVALELPESWTVATPLAASPAGAPRAFEAADYDELVDSPILFGDLRRADFVVRGIPFAAVWDARLGFDADVMTAELSRDADLEIGLFGRAPFDRYQFLYLLTPDPSGNGDSSLAVGIEHRRSTLITLDPNLVVSPAATREVVDETNAHELFHAWNVKAIHPRALHRPDYATGPRVPSLWWLEGVTSYYADRVVAATAPDREDAEARLLAELAGDVTRRVTGSLERIGADVPTAGLESMSPIYDRGAGIGFLLDVEIRAATSNRAGLDDVMRRLYERSRDGAEPFEDGDVASACSAVAGRDMSDFFRRYVAGSETPPVDRILSAAGWRLGPGGRTIVSEPSVTPVQREIQRSILSLK